MLRFTRLRHQSTTPPAGQLNVDAFLDQARGDDEASNSPLGWYLRNAQTRQLTHPLPVARAREIDEWARSPEFRALGVAPAPKPSGLTDGVLRGDGGVDGGEIGGFGAAGVGTSDDE